MVMLNQLYGWPSGPKGATAVHGLYSGEAHLPNLRNDSFGQGQVKAVLTAVDDDGC